MRKLLAIAALGAITSLAANPGSTQQPIPGPGLPCLGCSHIPPSALALKVNPGSTPIKPDPQLKCDGLWDCTIH